jgi:hypothetical protein
MREGGYSHSSSGNKREGRDVEVESFALSDDGYEKRF